MVSFRKQCDPLGLGEGAPTTFLAGAPGKNTGAVRAKKADTIRIIIPIAAIRFLNISLKKAPSLLRLYLSVLSFSACINCRLLQLLVFDPGIDHAIDEIRDQVRYYHA